MPIHFQVGKLPDKTIIDTIEAIEAAFGAESKNFQSGEILFQDNGQSLKEKSVSTYIISEARIRTKGGLFNVQIHRDDKKPNSTYFDDINITPKTNPTPSSDDLLRLDDIIRSKIKMPALAKIGASNENAVAGLLEKEMATIASMHEKLLADALDLRKTYELQDAERRIQFEQEQREAEKVIKEREQSSLERIASEKADLDERIKGFDFSDHMRARRKLREDISSQVQNFLREPLTPTESRLKFLLIIAVCILAAIGSGFLAYESFESFIANTNAARSFPTESAYEIPNAKTGNSSSEAQGISQSAAQSANEQSGSSSSYAQSISRSGAAQSNNSPPNSGYLLWLLAARGALLSAVAIGFTAYLISLLRNSYERDVQSHRELQRYGMDINRASWVIETAMEMTTKEGATLPEKWVEGAVYGLFQNQGNAESEVSSLAALGSIMGLAPEVSVGPDGTRVNFSPKATKKAAKESG
ncbi:MAG: hypothetical protein KF810_10645 [Rhizobiaceae bacterium]|nr:hypothetical protein [Rhizobiaceae bacterium]